MKQDQNCNFKGEIFLSRGGQAAVEYILLLVVVVSLIFGAKKAFGHLDDFIGHYIGDYVTCLMEYGELPTFGVEDTNQKKHTSGSGKSCDDKYEAFSFEGGRPAVGGSGSGKGSGGSSSASNGPGGSGSKNNSSNASKGGKSGGGSDSNSDTASNSSGSSGKSSGSRSSNKSSPYASGAIKKSGDYGTADGGDSGNQKVSVLEDPDAAKKKKDGNDGRSRRMGSSYYNEKYRAISGTMQAEIEKSLPKKLRAPTVSVSKMKTDGAMSFGPYVKTFTPPEPKKIEIKEDDNSGFSFGYIIRWLIIAGMILAIVIFFGSQVMNYSNSSE